MGQDGENVGNYIPLANGKMEIKDVGLGFYLISERFVTFRVINDYLLIYHDRLFMQRDIRIDTSFFMIFI